ncbi:MAG: methylmalonyl Co-A mutase-associated GTPase MeaB [Aestuariivirgaceae bacterium]
MPDYALCPASMMNVDDTGLLAEQVRTGDRAALGRAITLIESKRSDHEAVAQDLLHNLLPDTGNAVRLGMTGMPGAGKSTLIEALGGRLTSQGHKVAVLAVDPTSQRTGGSILGDKTRMTRLSVDDNAFIRPSPAGATLGGVARRTRETMLVCEAAGNDVIIVETVGIGQSETTVAAMVDFFAVVQVAGAGDELQGIKKGVLEIADLIIVNKADGDNLKRANQAVGEYRAALHILTPANPLWQPQVLAVSALKGGGLDELWRIVKDHRAILSDAGALAEKRRDQQVGWMWSLLEDRLKLAVKRHPALASRLPDLEAAVRGGTLTPTAAVNQVTAALGLDTEPVLSARSDQAE